MAVDVPKHAGIRELASLSFVAIKHRLAAELSLHLGLDVGHLLIAQRLTGMQAACAGASVLVLLMLVVVVVGYEGGRRNGRIGLGGSRGVRW